MRKRIYLVIAVTLLASISCARAKQEEVNVGAIKLEEITARAEESSKAFINGDYEKFADLTYPRLVELMGGRAKFISSLEQQVKELKAQGGEFVSTSMETPKEVVPAESQLLALVPYTLKMKIPGSLLTQQSYLLAISNKDNINWTFIDVTDLSDAQIRIVVPNAMRRITFPKKQPPVIEQSP
jgi:hypothetical protein